MPDIAVLPVPRGHEFVGGDFSEAVERRQESCLHILRGGGGVALGAAEGLGDDFVHRAKLLGPGG